jgi:tripartite-type tricarboxylate transporter receptor subunit TctC
MKRRQLLLTLCTAAAGGGARARAAAEPPVVLVVPFAAGGASDVLARHVAPLLALALDSTVLVENLPGASGTLAAHKVLAAVPDGRTIFVVSSSETILPPLLMRSAKFKAQDFRLLAGTLSAPLALIGRAGLPAMTLDALLARGIDTSLPPLTCGHLGSGSGPHLAAEHFSRLSGVPLTLVPYRGGTPLTTDLVGGQLDLTFLPLAGPLLAVIQARKLPVYGVSGAAAGTPLAQMHPLLSAHPKLPGFAHAAWVSFALPTAVAESVAQRLNLHLNAALQSTAVQQLASQMGAAVSAPMSLADAARFFEAETSNLQALARTIGLQAL